MVSEYQHEKVEGWQTEGNCEGEEAAQEGICWDSKTDLYNRHSYINCCVYFHLGLCLHQDQAQILYWLISCTHNMIFLYTSNK